MPVVTVIPGTEPLHTVFARDADSAAAHDQLALADMGTKGCEIYHIFHNSLTDPALVAALRGARLIEADLDQLRLPGIGILGTEESTFDTLANGRVQTRKMTGQAVACRRSNVVIGIPSKNVTAERLSSHG